MNLQPGVIGLDSRGIDVARAIQRKGYAVVAYDHRHDVREHSRRLGISTVQSLDLLAESLSSKRIIWTFIDDQQLLDETLQTLQPYLAVSDIIIDGSASAYRDTISRGNNLQGFQIDYLDCGLSRTTEIDKSLCMVGGNKFAFLHCEKLIADIFGNRFMHCGRSGAGHLAASAQIMASSAEINEIAAAVEILINSEYTFNFAALMNFWNQHPPLTGKLNNLIEAFAKKMPLDIMPGNSMKEKIALLLQ